MSSTRLLDRVRAAARLRHLSLKTEKAYVQQIKRFIIFHGKKHPNEMNENHIRAYLSHLAVEKNVAASTQNVALAGLLFLYRDVLKTKLDRIEEVERARVSRHMPVVLTRPEVIAVLGNLCKIFRRDSGKSLCLMRWNESYLGRRVIGRGNIYSRRARDQWIHARVLNVVIIFTKALYKKL